MGGRPSQSQPPGPGPGTPGAPQIRLGCEWASMNIVEASMKMMYASYRGESGFQEGANDISSGAVP